MCEKDEGWERCACTPGPHHICEDSSRDSMQGYPLPTERQPAPWHSEGIR